MAPAVSIVIPMYNDESFIEAALRSCAEQTRRDIEIICVDDASTDRTADVVGRFAESDDRVRLVRQPENASAFQARRVGILAATAPFVLFLDGDDELAPHAVQTTLTRASKTGADVVGFGVEILAYGGAAPRRFERALQPRHAELVGSDIVTNLFPVGEEANGHLWRYLFATELLRSAYAGLPSDATFYRANDLPITFLALSHARKYVSTPDRLYRYNFQRGTSGHAIEDVDQFDFLLSGIDPISAVAPSVAELDASREMPGLQASYESARLHIVGNILRYCMRDTAGQLQRECLDLLTAKVGKLQVVRAAAQFWPAALPLLTEHASMPTRRSHVQNILLTTAHLDTGGLQSVLVEHAAALAASGFTVTIAVFRDSLTSVPVPVGVDVVQIGGGLLARIDEWTELCTERSIDLIIDHHILYNQRWPWLTLAALANGIPTVGWLHNFALRPLFDHNQRIGFLAAHARLLLSLVTLSPTDVAFWKLQGIENVVFIPNPTSALMRQGLLEGAARGIAEDRLELAWWGRLDVLPREVVNAFGGCQASEPGMGSMVIVVMEPVVVGRRASGV